MVAVPQNSFSFRMGAGFAGDVNRTHPASVEPVLNDATNPVLTAGLGCVINAAKNGVRQMAAGDTAVTRIYGIAVRAYPIQDPGTSAAYGAQAQGSQLLPSGQAIDVIRDGYINVPVVGTPGKGDPAFIWVAASGGGHTQGGFEAQASGGNTATLANVFFNGAPDSNGIAEVVIGLD
jgi:hypothetical protein